MLIPVLFLAGGACGADRVASEREQSVVCVWTTLLWMNLVAAVSLMWMPMDRVVHVTPVGSLLHNHHLHQVSIYRGMHLTFYLVNHSSGAICFSIALPLSPFMQHVVVWRWVQLVNMLFFSVLGCEQLQYIHAYMPPYLRILMVCLTGPCRVVAPFSGGGVAFD